MDPKIRVVQDKSGDLYRFSTDDLRHGVRPVRPGLSGHGVAGGGGIGAGGGEQGIGSDDGLLADDMMDLPLDEEAAAEMAGSWFESRRTQKRSSGSRLSGSAGSGTNAQPPRPQWKARASAAEIQSKRVENHCWLLWQEVVRGLKTQGFVGAEVAVVKAQLQHVLGARHHDPRAMLFHARLPEPGAEH